MIYITDEEKKTVSSILKKYPYTFYAFGSRVKGTHRKFSDLDICFIEDIPWAIRARIREDFDQSNLPFLVDIVDFNRSDEKFQEQISSDWILLQKKHT